MSDAAQTESRTHGRRLSTRRVATVLTVLVGMFVAASTVHAAISLQLTPAEGLTFSAQVGGPPSASQQVTLTNSGDESVQGIDVAVTGDAARFPLVSNCGSELAGGASCTIDVSFAAANATTVNASLQVTSSNAPPQSVALNGTGTPAPAPVAGAAPSSLSFSTPVGTTSATQAVTLTNSGDGPLTIGGLFLGGADPAAFAFDNGCPSTLAAGAQCSVGVRYHPAAGGAVSATLTFSDDDRGVGDSTQTVGLTGTPAAAPVAGVTPQSLRFSAPAGTMSAAQTVTLRNTGTASLSDLTVAIVGADFTVVRTTCLPSTTLAPGSSCTVDVTFSPPSPGGPFVATLRFTENDPVNPALTVPLSGTSSPAPDEPVVVVPPPATTPPPPPPPPAATPPAADADHDGVGDAVDRCRLTPGDLASGCPSELNAEIRGSWRVNRLLSQLMNLSVRVTPGSRIVVRCTSVRFACGFTQRVVARTTKRTTSLTRFFKGRRLLPAGTLIAVRVTRPLQIGTFKRLTTRRGRRLPRVLLRCLSAVDGTPQACP